MGNPAKAYAIATLYKVIFFIIVHGIGLRCKIVRGQ